MQKHPLVVRRIKELQAVLVEVDLHDRSETAEFVLAGLKRLALNGDNSAAQLGAYRMIGSLSHARMFDAPQQGQAPDQRTADSIRKALKGRMERLLPAPSGANGALATGGGAGDEGGADEGGEAVG